MNFILNCHYSFIGLKNKFFTTILKVSFPKKPAVNPMQKSPPSYSGDSAATAYEKFSTKFPKKSIPLKSSYSGPLLPPVKALIPYVRGLNTLRYFVDVSPNSGKGQL